MGTILFYNDTKNKYQFKIDYPYYGLFGSAEITPSGQGDELQYHCRLLNQSIVILKKAQQKKWIDMELNCETPLSSTIGSAIDDFLKSSGTKKDPS